MSMNAALVVLSTDDAHALADCDPEELIEFFETGIDIGKAWAAVGWLFLRCGLTNDPIIGGDEFIGEDFSYGPLIHFTPGLVRDLTAQMAAVTADDLTRMLDLDELQAAGAYPEIWDRPEEAEDNRAWVLSEASAVAQLYRLAAQNGHGVTTLIG